MDLIKVIDAKEMKRIEKKSIEQGADPEAYMTLAAENATQQILHFLKNFQDLNYVSIVTGKGNNGGDGFAIAHMLKDKGVEVKVFALFPKEKCSPLSQKQREIFEKKSKSIIDVKDPRDLAQVQGIIVDAILGTGFEGSVESPLREVIEMINQIPFPKVAIDIPSGLNGNTGCVESVAIKAYLTIYLGAPKTGYFLEEGMNHIGQLIGVDFGLDQKYLDEANASFSFFNEALARFMLPPVAGKRHKYDAGYTIALAGGDGMYGAAHLCCLAAMRSGTGIIKLFYPQQDQLQLSSFPPEIIKVGYEESDFSLLFKELQRASSFLIGPGLSKNDQRKPIVHEMIMNSSTPLVIDADGLYFIKDIDLSKVNRPIILTPHKGELMKLLNIEKSASEASILLRAQEYVEKNDTVIIFKGAATFVIAKGIKPIVLTFGSPGMATAGAGDVLTGVIASMLSLTRNKLTASLLSVYIHQVAGYYATASKGPHSVLASDIISSLPTALQSISTNL